MVDSTGGKKANETNEKKLQDRDSEKGLWRNKGENKGWKSFEPNEPTHLPSNELA